MGGAQLCKVELVRAMRQCQCSKVLMIEKKIHGSPYAFKFFEKYKLLRVTVRKSYCRFIYF